MVVIIGAGISGLSAALHLEKESVILEKEDHVGGLSTQYRSAGYWFDYGGHYFHFKDKPEIKAFLEDVSPFNEYRRKSKVFALNRYIPFPIQSHLSFLPAKLRDTMLEEILAGQRRGGDNLAQYLRSNFGPTLYDFFFKPFLTKYYGTDPKHLAANMDKGSIPVPDKESVAQGARGKRFYDAGYNPFFYYPKDSLRGFMQSFSKRIPAKARLMLNQEVKEIDIERRRLKTQTAAYEYEHLVSTMPLKHLLEIIKQKERFPAPQKLRHISTLVVNVVLERKRKRFHWVYLPEMRFPFYRVGFYPTQRVPVAYLEKTVKGETAIGSVALQKEIRFTLKALHLIESASEIRHFDARFIPVSHIIFDKEWHTIVPPLLENLKRYGIYSIGRYGAWNYTSMSDDVKSAIQTAQTINRQKQ